MMVVKASEVKLTPAQEKFLIDGIRFFMARGWTIWAAFGLLANFYAECKFDPTVVGDRGWAVGIAQWHSPRRAAFKALFKSEMTPQTPVEQQLEFVHWELRKGAPLERKAGNLLSGARTAGEAGAIVSRYYERPRHVEAEAKARAEVARVLFDRYANLIQPGITA